MTTLPEEAVKAADRAIADIIGKHSNVSTEALARAAIDAGAPFLAPHKMNCADLEEAIRLAEIGEYLYNRSYSYGDGYSEPREYGIEWQWQQTKPNEFGQGALLGEAVRWHKEQAEDGVITEASKLRRALRILSALEPSAARELALEEAAKIAFDISENGEYHGEASVDSASSIYQQGAFEVYEAIRTLSSPDHIADAGKVEGDGWKPIESAPKDGTVILVYREDAGVFTAHYVEEDAHLSSIMNPPEGDFYWFSTAGDDLTNDMPTHWRPLPSAPSEGAE